MTLKDIENKLNKEVVFRSCWNCNSAHKHLKNEKDFIIYCIECGNLYLNGKKIKVADLVEKVEDKGE